MEYWSDVGILSFPLLQHSTPLAPRGNLSYFEAVIDVKFYAFKDVVTSNFR
jgi:hypothetical protein